MRDLIFLAVMSAFIYYGFRAPFVMLLGYIWVDIFSPQTLAYGFLTKIPLSVIMAGLTVLSIARAMDAKGDRAKAPVLSDARPWMILFFAVWMTLTTMWAEFPQQAWMKWDWAIKAVVFSLIIPYSIKNRVQLEALVLVIIVSLCGDIVARGVKAAVSGGGYGHDLGLHQGNSGLAEGSTFALTAISLIPLIAYFYQSSRLFSGWYIKAGVAFGIACAFLAAFGTFERTAIVTAAALVVFALYSQRKRPLVLFAFLAVLAGAISAVPALMGDGWLERMNTMLDTSETSSNGRLIVWEWTIGYANSHPWGGGFDIYLRNGAETVLGSPKAFHSIWFEVLGEQGWVGFVVFLLLIGTSLVSLARIAGAAKTDPSLAWASKLGGALFATITIYCVGGSFVGIAYQSLLWYYLTLSVALSISLRNVRTASSLSQASGGRALPQWAVGARSGPHPATTATAKLGTRQPKWARRG